MSDTKNDAKQTYILMRERERERERYKPSLILLALLACAALLLASCPPEAKTAVAKAAPPQLAISYCGVDGITSLTLVMGETPQQLTASPAASWSSSDPATADVDAAGTITLNKATAVNTPVFITARNGSAAASFELTVLAPLTAPAKPSIAVKTEADLSLIRCRLDATYTLANDITLVKEWAPVGDDQNPFSGTLDGAGHAIKNLVINKPNGNYVGLIAYNTGTIKNIGVELGAAGITGLNTIGGLAGGNNGGSVSGVVRGSGAITATGTNSSGVGGLVGQGYGGSVIGYSSVAINTRISNVGGLVGFNSGSVTGYAEGNITGASFTGGLVGHNSLGKSVVGYYVSGTVKGFGVSVGGLAGDVYSTLAGYSRGAVAVSSRQAAGRVVGNADANATVNAYYSGKAGESAVTGGTPNSVGTSITIDPSKTKEETDYFGKLTFGTAAGQWTFHQGKWPSINFPADKIFDPYRGEKQPVDIDL